jgi:hypothetical protein
MVSISSIGNSLHIVGYVGERLDDINFLNDFNTRLNKKEILNNNENEISILTKRKENPAIYKHWERRRTGSYRRRTIPRQLKLDYGKKNIKSNLQKQKRLRLFRKQDINNKTKEKLIIPSSSIDITRCRKHRRRIDFLTKIIHNMYDNKYNNDINNNQSKWLQTHLWHRKRMTMNNLWGFCLPLYHSGRGLKTIIKSLKDNATLYDNSYIRPLELESNSLDIIRDILSLYLDPSCEFMNLTDLNNEVTVLFYSKNQFPSACLGPISIYCLPTGENNESVKVWLWTHPVLYELLKKELQDESKLQIDKLNNNNEDETSNYCIIDGISVGLTRFSIRGGDSARILRDSLLPDTLISDPNSSEVFFNDLINSLGLYKIWQNGQILSMNVIDNRSNFDNINIESNNSNSSNNYRKKKLTWPVKNNNSILYNDSGRKSAAKSFIKDHIINEERKLYYQQKYKLNNELQDENNMVDQDNNNIELNNGNIQETKFNKINSFPIILIRKEYNNNDKNRKLCINQTHNLSGWDILVSSNWGSYVWNRLHLAKAKAIGVNEMDYINLNSGVLSYPRDYPDTSAGKLFWLSKYDKDLLIDNKKPPKKRLGLNGLQIPKWNNIINSDDKEDEKYNSKLSNDIKQFVVVREKKYLSAFNPFIDIACYCAYGHPIDIPSLPDLPYTTLVSVMLAPTGRGVPFDGAEILSPTSKDYQK